MDGSYRFVLATFKESGHNTVFLVFEMSLKIHLRPEDPENKCHIQFDEIIKVLYLGDVIKLGRNHRCGRIAPNISFDAGQ